jgi:hypothetical protein
MKVILEIPDEEVEIIKRNGFNKDGTFSFKLNEVLKQAIRNGVVLPDNATNGDVIKALFPNATVYSYKDSFDMYSDVVICPQNFMLSADRDFWNAPYKGGTT